MRVSLSGIRDTSGIATEPPSSEHGILSISGRGMPSSALILFGLRSRDSVVGRHD